jgi:hypothetical protein
LRTEFFGTPNADPEEQISSFHALRPRESPEMQDFAVVSGDEAPAR